MSPRARGGSALWFALLPGALLLACVPLENPLPPNTAPPRLGPPYEAFGRAAPVEIRGYPGDAMEPFLSRDGRTLLFNNSNHPSVDTNLHFAERVGEGVFEYKGWVIGSRTDALEGAPTMDRFGVLYFVSTRSYGETFSTIHRADFDRGSARNVALVPGVSRATPGVVNFDVDVTPDGRVLTLVDSWFGRARRPQTADLVIARRAGSAFQRDPASAEILANVNSAWLEYAPCTSGDGRELFFTRVEAITREALPRIYVSRRETPAAPFGLPREVVAASGFVEGPALSPDERTLYFHRRDGDRFRVYRATR